MIDLVPPEIDDAVLAYAAMSFPPGRPVGAAVLDLTHRIHADFRYESGATSVTTRVAQVLADRRGVCQDFDRLAIAGLRGHGLAARYVSGYLATSPAPGRDRVVGADATHAWAEVRLPDGRRLAFRPDERHAGRRPLRRRGQGPGLHRREPGARGHPHRGRIEQVGGVRRCRAPLTGQGAGRVVRGSADITGARAEGPRTCRLGQVRSWRCLRRRSTLSPTSWTLLRGCSPGGRARQ